MRSGKFDMRGERGFSMIELMVGIVITLIVVGVIMQSLAVYDAQKRVTSGTSDATTNGTLALFQIKREARMAGFGLTSPSSLACPLGINIYYNGSVVLDGGALMPLMIVDGGTNLPDQIRFARSHSTWGIAPATIVKGMPTPSSIVTVGTSAGLSLGDLFLVGAPDGSKICALMQMSKNAQPTGNGWNLQHNPSYPYNPSNPANTFANAPNYVVGDIVTAVGATALTTYQIICNDDLAPSATNSCDLFSYDALTSASPIKWANAGLSHIASQIVTLQAQYGVAPVGSGTVNRWVDATGSWAAPAAADVLRIKAIRVAVVSRSSKYEKTIVSPASLVLWDSGTPTQLALSLSSAQQHYRYHVYYQVIPLINLIWAGP